MELISKLGIGADQIIAQIINFLVLMTILRLFVYKPVLKILEERQRIIKKGLEDAEKSRRQLEEAEVIREKRLAEAHKEIGLLLDKSRADAEVMKKEIVAAAQHQADELLRRAKIQLEEEKVNMIRDVKAEVGSFVISLTEKLLQREFSKDDQKRLADAVAHEMKSI